MILIKFNLIKFIIFLKKYLNLIAKDDVIFDRKTSQRYTVHRSKLRNKNLKEQKKKGEEGWIEKNSNTVDFRGRVGRGRYAPARRNGVPFPSQRLNVDVSLSAVLFSLPRARYSVSTSVEIPRGAHSIIRYLCRGEYSPQEKPSIEQETLTLPFVLSLCPSSSLPPPF